MKNEEDNPINFPVSKCRIEVSKDVFHWNPKDAEVITLGVLDGDVGFVAGKSTLYGSFHPTKEFMASFILISSCISI